MNGAIHPDLKRILDTAAPDEQIPIIVRFRRQSGRGPTEHGIAELAERAVFTLMPAVPAEGTPAHIRELAQHANVERIWFDLPVHTMLDRSVPLIRAPQVWEGSGQGAGVKVAILDTGCDLQHSDLQDRIKAHQDFSGKGDVQDGNGHGTHVASIIAGSGAASGGRYRGVAPQVDLFIAKVLDDRGGGRMSNVIAGLEWALHSGVRVVNMSLGSDVSCDGTDALSEACDAVVARGVVVAAAAGNSGPGAHSVGSPGCARSVITVGATDDFDAIARFSSRGPTADGRVKPDIVFPGVDIVAARAAGTALGRIVDNHYVQLSGTSMATPHATGAVALLLQAEAQLTPSQVKERLLATAIDLGQDANSQGKGRGDVFAAWQ
ncbi:MAG: S8 family peptidase, partial [Chloroflexi bacterium]|nr:S8 family peptidase [Chloroflexota bacterium]